MKQKEVFTFGSKEMQQYLDNLAKDEPTKYYRLKKWSHD